MCYFQLKGGGGVHFSKSKMLLGEKNASCMLLVENMQKIEKKHKNVPPLTIRGEFSKSQKKASFFNFFRLFLHILVVTKR